MDVWSPGSFTKNYRWGPINAHLSALHRAINLGFNNVAEDVPRKLFIERIAIDKRPYFIPTNFFLFNRQFGGEDFIVADELVFQAINWEHNASFDKLAMFTFTLSLVGKWKGASKNQERPALWANAYVRERVSPAYDFSSELGTADDIERFVRNDQRYKGETTRKLATNLAYLFKLGRVSEFKTNRIERWWVDCLFLALDRIIEFRATRGQPTPSSDMLYQLGEFDFLSLSGKRTLEKEFALKHLVALYDACGGRNRFSVDATRERTQLLSSQVAELLNDDRPRGAVHLSNPRILKSIPPACAMLARYAGFETLSPDEMENFDLEEFIKLKTRLALEKLKSDGVKPTMTADDIMRITRDR